MARTRVPSEPRPAPDRARVERWAQVTARDLMRTSLVTIPSSMALSDVERVLADHSISGAPVTDAKGRIVGILSWRDVIDRYAEDPDSRPRRDRGWFHVSSEEMSDDEAEAFELPKEAEETAADVMSADVYTVRPDAGLQEIATAMVAHGIHRLLVEEEGRFLGILSTTEVLNALSA
jgi:CBS domain-containing protein